MAVTSDKLALTIIDDDERFDYFKNTDKLFIAMNSDGQCTDVEEKPENTNCAFIKKVTVDYPFRSARPSSLHSATF